MEGRQRGGRKGEKERGNGKPREEKEGRRVGGNRNQGRRGGREGGKDRHRYHS